MNDIRVTIRLNKDERMCLDKFARIYKMSISSYIRQKIFEHNIDLKENQKIYHCPNSEKLNYIQVALAKQTQELVLYLLKREYGDQCKEILERSFDITEERLASQYNYKKIEVQENE